MRVVLESGEADPDVAYWLEVDPAWNDARYYIVEALKQSPDVRVETSEHPGFLGPVRDVLEVTVSAAQVGGTALIGAAVVDAWKSVRGRWKRELGESSTPSPLDREDADHMARWFVGTTYGIGDWGVALDTLLTVVADEQPAPDTWTFTYEDREWRYEVTVTRPDEMPHAVKSSIKRERLPGREGSPRALILPQ
jgi:hypothetical protein